MTINMSNLDRTLRAFAALLLIALYFIGTLAGTTGMIGLVVAVVFLGTAVFGNCPLYTILGFSTCPTKS